ncbi:MAG TPA: DNA polymerase ligase N-terminal domain-containing protein [Planctomycetota bacterium]|nr:DNA polymerase ligase N-terminal domain-containing protein [Planctomycetota bacterium]
MPRFTISHHTGSKDGDHYDLMLEFGDGLRTWRLVNTAFQVFQIARQIKDHRKTYLDFEGEISGERGRVKIWDTGNYSIDEWKDDRIQVALVGRSLKTRLLLTLGPKHPEDADPRWNVGDATQEIRKAAAALLRGASLDDAPNEDLVDLRRALAHEERKILSLVDQYTRGGTIDWSHTDLDPDVRKRIDKERVRWQHPWLAAAKGYADKLGELTEILRQSRPKQASS